MKSETDMHPAPSPQNPSPESGFRIRGWHVLVAMIAFFGLITALLSTFTWLALKSDPGVVSETPYEDGLAYNATLAQRRKEAALGWRVVVEDPVSDSILRVQVLDKTGTPMPDMTLTGALSRPTSDKDQARVTFSADPASHTYVASLPDKPGVWDIQMRIAARDGRILNAHYRYVP
ncbi:MAG: FixH family protein [Asticcacaulis sp.]